MSPAFRAALRLIVTLVSLSMVSLTFAQTDNPPQFIPGPCPVRFAAGQAECGVVVVPQDRANPDERTVELAVAVFPARSTPSLPDPVIFLDGGPGARTLDSLAGGLGILMTQLNRSRDVIIFDYRGIGYSDPSMICTEAADAPGDDWLSACRQRYADDGVDVTDYTTRDNAADAADIMAALGYTSYNIWGGSYGSSVAMTLLRDQPQGVRAALITALQPPQGDLQAETPVNVMRILDEINALCRADADCAQALPGDLEDLLVQVIERLDADPLSLEAYGRSGDLTGLDVLIAVSEMLKDETMIPQLPGLIGALYAGTYDWLVPYANVLTDVTLPPNNYGAWLSMRCTDSILATSEDALNAATSQIPDGIRSTFMDFHHQQAATCLQWGARVPTSADRQPAVTDTPTLIISGALDPFSSQAWLDSALETLPNGRGFLVPYHMHYVQHQPCALSMMTRFIDDPTAELDASCFDTIPAPSFRVR